MEIPRKTVVESTGLNKLATLGSLWKVLYAHMMKVFLFKLGLACERHYTNILGTFFLVVSSWVLYILIGVRLKIIYLMPLQRTIPRTSCHTAYIVVSCY